MNAAEARLRPARAADLEAIRALLGACALPASDLTSGHLRQFVVAEQADAIVGVAGVETAGDAGLLRSLAVAAALRGQGVGARLVARCEDLAASAGTRKLYLLTTTADAFSRARDYRDVERANVPAAITGHPQFRGLCPASAKCLAKAI